MPDNLDLFSPRKPPKAAVPQHFLNLLDWNLLGDAFVARGKPARVRRGLYAVKGGGWFAYGWTATLGARSRRAAGLTLAPPP